MEKWFVINKGADFEKLGKEFGISPVTARLIRNREVIGEAAFERYLNGSLKDLYDPHLLKDADRLTDILKVKIEEQKPVRIIGDYDIDGVMSTYILYRGIQHCGGNVSTQIPDRMKDGYGINENLIDQAKRDGMDTILTCDNGIAAISEIAHAKELGMTVLVTDHHEIPYTEENGEKQFLRSNADAIVNPKQRECAYPFKELCGAAVAWKVLQVLYEKMGFALEETYEFLENVAFATVGDVMDLTDENRILVKEGLNRIHRTKNPGMRALIFQNHLEPEQINAYHFGFVLGPCINASGRLDTAKLSLSLFLQGEEEAAKTARELVELNQQRKDMTADGVEEAKRVVEEHYMSDKVLVIYLPLDVEVQQSRRVEQGLVGVPRRQQDRPACLCGPHLERKVEHGPDALAAALGAVIGAGGAEELRGVGLALSDDALGFVQLVCARNFGDVQRFTAQRAAALVARHMHPGGALLGVATDKIDDRSVHGFIRRLRRLRRRCRCRPARWELRCPELPAPGSQQLLS